ncbi:MAG TPA: PhoH family protein [Alphaproteobacteria bacterium]|jgi:phosphate starvation-inducible PhoH-like protein
MSPADSGLPPLPPGLAEAPLQLEFDDNRLLPQLYGEHDRNLARIESALGVQLVSRGNRLAVTGPAAGVEQAKRTLNVLYSNLKLGLPADSGALDAALRLAQGNDGPPRVTRGGTATRADGDLVISTRRRQISPRSGMQATYLRAMRDNEMVFGIGPAGTGKTYLAVAAAVAALTAGEVDRIVLSRPAVEAGERLGFLPGDMREKVDPYLRPLYDALYDMLPMDQVEKRLESGEIEVAPLAFMRGRTLAHSFVILDEAQNTTPMQMKMCLTRLGEGSRMIVTGDLSQVDLPTGARSGLTDALETLSDVEGVAIVRFSDVDVMRHPVVARIVRAYEKADKARAERVRPSAPGAASDDSSEEQTAASLPSFVTQPRKGE